MNNIDEKMSELFNVEPCISSQNALQTVDNTQVNVPAVISDTEVIDDISYARNNIKNLIDKSNEAIEEILNVARHSEHPRAYEVASTFIKTVSDMNRDLLHLHNQKKILLSNTEYQKTSDVSIDKAVFVGSTNDLIKMLKK